MYGSPMNSGKHVQEPALFRSAHTALMPHGVGVQGFLGPSITKILIKI